jgi:hypothetical protein
MTELILSEITRMAGGYCVIGLERIGDAYRSVRPMPPRGYAWGYPWPHQRGDRLRFQLHPLPPVSPHVEDCKAAGAPQSLGQITHGALVNCLRSAEVGQNARDFFGCELRVNPFGAGAGWVNADAAVRSICGCEFRFLRFYWRLDRWRVELRLTSGNALKGLPIVDHDWNSFLEQTGRAVGGVNREQRLQRFLNGEVAREILEDDNHFARLGLARPNPQGMCWLMLDSLFPLPKNEWVAQLSEGH